MTVIRFKPVTSRRFAVVVAETRNGEFVAKFQVYVATDNGSTVLIEESSWSHEHGAIHEWSKYA